MLFLSRPLQKGPDRCYCSLSSSSSLFLVIALVEEARTQSVLRKKERKRERKKKKDSLGRRERVKSRKEEERDLRSFVSEVFFRNKGGKVQVIVFFPRIYVRSWVLPIMDATNYDGIY